MSKQERALDLREILLYLWQHIVIIVVCMLAGGVGTISITQYAASNELPCQATALIYLDTRKTPEESSTDASKQLEFYTNITSLTSVIVKSKPVLKPVVEKLGLEMEASELANCVSVESVGSSSFMRLRVRGSDPEMVKSICNEILAVMPDASASMTNLGVLQAASQAELAAVAKPDFVKAAAVGILLGIIVSALVLICFELFDHTIRDAGDVAYYLDLETLGVIPEMHDRKNTEEKLEAYRSLCVNLTGCLSSRICPVVLVAGVCKTDLGAQTAEEMSKTFAQTGKKVLLIDADLHGGQISARLGMNGVAGFAELLRKEVSADTALVYSETLESMVISSGTQGESKSVLPIHEAENLLEEFRKQFDIIIVYTSNVTATSDAALLGRMSDGVLLVARVGKTTIESALLAKEKMKLVKAPVCGVTLTDYDYKKARRRDGYYYAFSASRV